jgi:hypothetical protein
MSALLLALFVTWCVCAVFTAMVASSRGRPSTRWFFAGLLFGPIALLAVGFMPAADRTTAYVGLWDEARHAFLRTFF